MPHVLTNGFRTYYRQMGEGPDVVLIHGFTSNMAIWVFISMMDTLAADFRVTAYDLRGHGNSDIVANGYSTDVLAGDCKALHAALQLESACVVGHSLGGVVGTHAAALYPDAVGGVILSDSYFPGLADIEPATGDTTIWADLQRIMARAGIDIGDTIDFRRLCATVEALTPEQHEAVRKHMGVTGARWLLQIPRMSAIQTPHEVFLPAGLDADSIRSLQQPLVGLYDEHSPFTATYTFLRENVPKCTIDIVPGSEHFAIFENSTALVAMVYKHLCDLSGIGKPTYSYQRCALCNQPNLIRSDCAMCSLCGNDL